MLLAALLVTLGGAAAGLGPAAAAPRPGPRPRPAVDGVAELLQRHLAPPSLQHRRSSSHTQQEAGEFNGSVNEQRKFAILKTDLQIGHVLLIVKVNP